MFASAPRSAKATAPGGGSHAGLIRNVAVTAGTVLELSAAIRVEDTKLGTGAICSLMGLRVVTTKNAVTYAVVQAVGNSFRVLLAGAGSVSVQKALSTMSFDQLHVVTLTLPISESPTTQATVTIDGASVSTPPTPVITAASSVDHVEVVVEASSDTTGSCVANFDNVLVTTP